MKLVYESEYMQLYFNSENKVIEEKWHETTKKMRAKEFKKEILTTLKYMRDNNAELYLVDTKNFIFTISVEIQEWMHKNFIVPFIQAGIKKAAFVMPEELITQLSIEQTTEEDTQNKFKRDFFTSKKEALKWLEE